MQLRDQLGRPPRSLRLSVTDRCNLRCGYCMPEELYRWLPRADLLTFEEIATVVEAFVQLGVDRLRITGGEPLMRRDLPVLVELLSTQAGIRDLALTTNAVLLAEQARALKAAGLHRLTVSLDTLDRERFKALVRRDELDRVLAGIEVARQEFGGLKLDTVVQRGVNDDEVVGLLEYARSLEAELRFIEYMDVGGATRWSPDRVLSRDALLERLAQHYGGRPQPIDEVSSAPADRYRLPDGLVFGIIASTTAPFCRSCDRSRLTADGHWLLCLYARTGLDLRTPLRAGAGPGEIAELLAPGWRARADRGAEERLTERDRRALAAPEELRENVHLEMHTRGG